MPIIEFIRELLAAIGLKGEVEIYVAAVALLLVNVLGLLIQSGITWRRERNIRKAQTELDSTLKKLQTNLDVRSHVTRAMFDLEFSIYRELWKKIIVYRNHIGRFIYNLKQHGNTQEYPDELKEALIDSINSINDYSQYIDDHLPFFSLEVQDKLGQLHDQGQIVLETIDFMGNGKVNFQESYNEIQKMVPMIQAVGTSIRERLDNIIVVE